MRGHLLGGPSMRVCAALMEKEIERRRRREKEGKRRRRRGSER